PTVIFITSTPHSVSRCAVSMEAHYRESFRERNS
ncbi:hypothetical protein ACUXI4_004570, partial [Pantoea piersonii]